ncbi:hypothetical protein [Salipiger thiooxidans]|uniref:hypothetical protein n=1 Tax=Salipiger thiooxidans TaxID=282683 RepID=UPI001CD3FBE6|nr:hypothetical protein [Salipiger thiooxidans]MCA0851492.1 hypothetical protein [Salipiger thiooxidans]
MTTKSPSRPPRLLVIGHGRHGKDTAAALLAQALGVSWASSSEFVAQRAVWPLVEGRGPWRDWQAMYEDRHAHREMWFHAIAAYNLAPGPSLAEQLLEDHAIYVGMRRRAELVATRQLFDCVVWVDGSRRLPGEDPASMQLTRRDADLILDNNGTREDLERSVTEAVHLIACAIIV